MSIIISVRFIYISKKCVFNEIETTEKKEI